MCVDTIFVLDYSSTPRLALFPIASACSSSSSSTPLHSSPLPSPRPPLPACLVNLFRPLNQPCPRHHHLTIRAIHPSAGASLVHFLIT